MPRPSTANGLSSGASEVTRARRVIARWPFSRLSGAAILSGEHGPGVLKGQLEMVIEVTPVFVAFQSGHAEGTGFSPVMFRWNFRQYRAIQPFVDAAAGMTVTNRDVPENTTRLNFAEHAGIGTRLRVAERWALVVGYRLHHLSNNGTAARNPGVTSHVGYAGVSWMSRQ